ncbi:MAG: polysaccharide pyruvyl transferase family protein, partial [Candidatus Hodarchaeota archaeon]
MTTHPMGLLKQKLEEILKTVPKGSKIAYLEYPVYANIGDILIMKGTEKFFAENHMDVICRHSLLDFSLKKKFPADSILVFQGGGNLGDLYCVHQRFRETCIKRYKDYRIVILPQTVYFKNPRNLERSARVFSQHPDLHLFLRDQRSYDIARDYLSDNTSLMPDMAHA